MTGTFSLGAHYEGEQQCSFAVWAPNCESLELHVVAPSERVLPLRKGDNGYFTGLVEGVGPGSRYFYRLDGNTERPDPASRLQPQGVHGPSEIVAATFSWEDAHWFGTPLRDYIIYELHVGTFTEEGTFDAIIPELEKLKELGVTAIELMPVGQFPGNRNWGYDGVFPFAVQDSYGGPEALKRLVNAAHLQGLAVVLDVVYNHLGPEGNHLRDFAPYFTERYQTPWGAALNFDGEHSAEVRRFFFENARQWQSEFHIDALRLDAVHTIRDFSAIPFLQELARQTRRQAEVLNRRCYLIAESDLNDPRLISPEVVGGYGLDAQWTDDFHHCLHVLLTGERDGYYADYGGVEQLAKLFEQAYAYTGQYSRFRKRPHGSPARLNTPGQFVVFSQNHDQVGNRLQGDRLSRLADPDVLKLAAGAVLLSPFIPLLFMGEEYGEPAPFQYVISHTDPELVEAVRRGRREEFSGFDWRGEVPDPQSEETFRRCVLRREACCVEPSHRALYEFYRELVRVRKAAPEISLAQKEEVQAQGFAVEQALLVLFGQPAPSLLLVLGFAGTPHGLDFQIPEGTWKKLLDSSDPRWGVRNGESGAPDKIEARGAVSLRVPARCVLLFRRTRKF